MVINDGQIEEQGSHDALMRAKGHYYNLYTQQFRHELETQLDPFVSVDDDPSPKALTA